MTISANVKARYDQHFGPDAFVPGYCGKCPGALPHASFVAVCGVLDGETRVNHNSEPPEWCPIRHISTRYATGEISGDA